MGGLTNIVTFTVASSQLIMATIQLKYYSILKNYALIASTISLFRSWKTGSFLLMFLASETDGLISRVCFFGQRPRRGRWPMASPHRGVFSVFLFHVQPLSQLGGLQRQLGGLWRAPDPEAAERSPLRRIFLGCPLCFRRTIDYDITYYGP